MLMEFHTLLSIVYSYYPTQATGIVLGTIVQALCSLIAGILIAFISTWELALLLLVAFPVITLTNYFQIRLLGSRAREDKKKLEESGDTAVESIDGINTVTSLGLQQHFSSKYMNLLNGPFRYNINVTELANNIILFCGMI